MKILVFVFILFSKICSESIKPTDFCIKPSECEKTSDECLNFKCNGNLSYDCKGFCSTEKNSCKSFFIWSSLKNNHSKNLNKFTSKIAKCQKNEWTGQDVCHNRKMCIKSLKSIECKCTSKYSHVCGNGYCAVDKHGCQKLRKAEKSMKKLKINECINENTKTRNTTFLNRLISLFSYSYPDRNKF